MLKISFATTNTKTIVYRTIRTVKNVVGGNYDKI